MNYQSWQMKIIRIPSICLNETKLDGDIGMKSWLLMDFTISFEMIEDDTGEE